MEKGSGCSKNIHRDSRPSDPPLIDKVKKFREPYSGERRTQGKDNQAPHWLQPSRIVPRDFFLNSGGARINTT